jgi:cystathionine beta-lyase family protein involved in aluminum resistance
MESLSTLLRLFLVASLLIFTDAMSISTRKTDAFAGLVRSSAAALAETFHTIDLQTMDKLQRVLTLFRENHVDAQCFHGVNGYGYGDVGREKFDNIIAQLFQTEAAIVRIQFFSGTHAIAKSLFAALRPGETMLSVSGHPYDTLDEVIGLRPDSKSGTYSGSLKDWQINYEEIDLIMKQRENGFNEAVFDLEKIREKLESNPSIRLLHIQRSCGYSWRPSIRVQEMKRLCDFVNDWCQTRGKPRESLVIFCDNCYGELVNDIEPVNPSIGVDLMAGSLIKNLGGTLAPCGGYVAGRKHLVDRVNNELSAPGVEGGATLSQYRHLYQGLFLAPSVIGESLKGAELLSYVLGTKLGFECNPAPGHVSDRSDIIQAVRLNDRKKLISFCESVHKFSPVGSYIKPVPGISAGYGEQEVIFADGTFIDGSTLELSADGPLRPPYVAFSQVIIIIIIII